MMMWLQPLLLMMMTSLEQQQEGSSTGFCTAKAGPVPDQEPAGWYGTAASGSFTDRPTAAHSCWHATSLLATLHCCAVCKWKATTATSATQQSTRLSTACVDAASLLK
jgi:hypothetical protein